MVSVEYMCLNNVIFKAASETTSQVCFFLSFFHFFFFFFRIFFPIPVFDNHCIIRFLADNPIYCIISYKSQQALNITVVFHITFSHLSGRSVRGLLEATINHNWRWYLRGEITYLRSRRKILLTLSLDFGKKYFEDFSNFLTV